MSPKNQRHNERNRFFSWLALLLWLSLGLLILGVFMPIMTVEKFFIFDNSISIITGIIGLFLQNDILLGIIIGVFSVLFPLLKIIICITIWYSGDWQSERVQRLLVWCERLGKWSMLDVFIIANLVVTMKLGIVANVQLHAGIYVFSASIIFAMIGTARLHALIKNSQP